MTTRNLSGLERARKWMDGLGMHHYGEVDAAIAKAGAGASGYSPARYNPTEPGITDHCPPPWQEMGFAAYASGALENRRGVGNDFDKLFDNPASEAAPQFRTPAETLVWNEALQAAKDLVNSSALGSTSRVDGCSLEAAANMRSAEGTATLNVRVNSINANALEGQHSIDVTCHANQALAIHIWI